MALIKLAALGALGYAGYRYYQSKQDKTPAAFADGQPQTTYDDPTPPVRNAGAEAMRDKPATWSKTDETVDESFPASDPAATY